MNRSHSFLINNRTWIIEDVQGEEYNYFRLRCPVAGYLTTFVHIDDLDLWKAAHFFSNPVEQIPQLTNEIVEWMSENVR